MRYAIVTMFTVLLCGLTSLTNGQAVEDTSTTSLQTQYGELRLRYFKNAPYPHPSRENGWQYNDTDYPAETHYSDSTVGIFIPVNYSPQKRVDYIVHFHGHMNHVAKVFSDFSLQQQVFKSGVNAILLVPQGPKNARDSGCGRLEEEPDAFGKLLSEVTNFLLSESVIKTDSIGKIVITAHSGGYKVTGNIVSRSELKGHITDLILFDATYSNLEGFAAWAKIDRSRRLVSIFTNHLSGENIELVSMLDDFSLPYSMTLDSRLSDKNLTSRKAHFIYTTELGHNELLTKKDYYSLFLQTSALAATN